MQKAHTERLRNVQPALVLVCRSGITFIRTTRVCGQWPLHPAQDERDGKHGGKCKSTDRTMNSTQNYAKLTLLLKPRSRPSPKAAEKKSPRSLCFGPVENPCGFGFVGGTDARPFHFFLNVFLLI